MNNENILEIVKETIKEVKFSLRDIELDSNVSFRELQIDSLDKIDLFFRLEEKFGLGFSSEQIAMMQTINDIVSYIKNNEK